MRPSTRHRSRRGAALPAVAILALATLAGACTGEGRPAPTASPSSSPPFRPVAQTAAIAVRLLDGAWADGDREEARKVANASVVKALFEVAPRGWSDPKCKQGLCRLNRRGVPDSMTWTVRGGSTGYFVSDISVPPIPLDVSGLTNPAWGLYLAAGSSGSSQLAAATSQLHGIGLTDGAIANLPVSCQGSAAERLQVPTSYFTVVVFFRTKAEAEAFQSALDFPPVGLVKVKVTC